MSTVPSFTRFVQPTDSYESSFPIFWAFVRRHISSQNRFTKLAKLILIRMKTTLYSHLKAFVLVQLSNDIFLLKRVSRYGRCFMIDSGSKGCPEQESAGCHFGTLGRNFLRAKTKWPPIISRANMIFQQMKPGTSVIPHFYVILTGQSISCIILMTYGHLQGQKDNF